MVNLKAQNMEKKTVLDIESQLLPMPKPVNIKAQVLRKPKSATGDKCYPKSHSVLYFAIILMGGLSMILIIVGNRYITRYGEYITTGSKDVIPNEALDNPYQLKIVLEYGKSTRFLCSIHRNKEQVNGCPALSVTHWMSPSGRKVFFCCLKEENGRIARTLKSPLIHQDVLIARFLSELWFPPGNQRNRKAKEMEETIPNPGIILPRQPTPQQLSETENPPKDIPNPVWNLSPDRRQGLA